MHSADFLEIRRTFLLGVRRLIRQAQANGDVRTDRPARTMAEMIFLLFAAQIRWWIANERPDVTPVPLRRFTDEPGRSVDPELPSMFVDERAIPSLGRRAPPGEMRGRLS